MCNKADNSCRQEKLGCKGCFYNEIKIRNYELTEKLQDDIIQFIDLVTRLFNENKELKEITNKYDVICKTDADYILIANKSYFDNGIFKNNLIHISKIIDLKKYYEEQAEETEKAYGKLRNISNLYWIYR